MVDFLYPHGDVACRTCGSQLRESRLAGSLIHYSLAPLYKHAKACPASAVTRRSNLCKYERSSTSLTTFILNWAYLFPPVHEIYQTAITPPSPLIWAPVLGASVWRVILADPGFLHVANPPNTLAKALAWVGGDVRGEVWFGSLFKRLVDL